MLLGLNTVAVNVDIIRCVIFFCKPCLPRAPKIHPPKIWTAGVSGPTPGQQRPRSDIG